MSEFQDKIPAARGRVDFLYDPKSGGIAAKIGGTGRLAVYFVAVSLDGRELLSTVFPAGLGGTMVYVQPSVLTYIQSDEQGMWGRNCPFCKKYFRTSHVFGVTFCPYCAAAADSLAFVSKDQRRYITAYYDAFARAHIGKTNTSLDISEITDNAPSETDKTPAWHYSEEKQQHHFLCVTKGCATATDILGVFGYCPKCGRTNARQRFFQGMDAMLKRLDEVKEAIKEDRRARGAIWEEMTKTVVSEFEPFAKHLRSKLLCFPMTPKRRKDLEGISFQNPLEADGSLVQWFDIGVLKWRGSASSPGRRVPQDEVAFVKKMLQKRHILVHNGGIVDRTYLDLSGDGQARLGQRIEVRSHEVKRFIECIRAMAANFLDNIEEGL